MAPSKKLITLSNLSFGYDDLPVLEQNSLSIQEGSLIGIIGPNGGGKTTFLKLLMGFLQPDQGIIKIFGKTPEQARTKIGYVPQYHKCDREFPITVLELVLLGALCKTSLFGVYPKKVKQQAFFLIEMLGLSEHIKKSFGSLSGGLAQRALFARALLSDPDLLLLDEPTANLDPASTNLILDTLETLKRKKTILIATHDWQTIAERVDQVLCIQRSITPYRPDEICRHVSLGLYHTPTQTSTEESHVPELVSQ